MNIGTSTSLQVHRALARSLADHGIRTLFGLIGDANLFMVDSFVREQGGRFVAAAHEAGAVLMAQGFAQVSNQIAAATITHGPGLTNAVTALVEAVRSRVPMVVLCGDTPADAPEHLQKIDQREIILATGAGFEQMRTAETTLDDIANAFRRAAIEQRPIVFNMPVDLQWETTVYRKHILRIPDRRALVPDSNDLDDALGIIAAAKRPVILAGRGAVDARDALLRLARRIEAPLSTTLRASGLFGGEPFALGVFGTLSTPVATDIILESDCVVAFGASLNMFTGSHGSFLQGKRVVQVDLDPRNLGSRWKPTIGIVGDAALTAERMIGLLDEAGIPGSGHSSPAMAQAIAGYKPEPRFPDWAGEPKAGTVELHEALRRIDAVVPAQRTIVTDLGRFVGEALRVLRIPDPRAYAHTMSFGAIGAGLPCAIGAAVAEHERPTVLISGDGGFMMGGLTELNTVARNRLDMIIVVCSDGSYGAEHVQFRNRSLDPRQSMFDWPDFAPVAEALGVRGVTVRNQGDLDAAVQAIAARDGPLLIDLRIDPERIAWG